MGEADPRTSPLVVIRETGDEARAHRSIVWSMSRNGLRCARFDFGGVRLLADGGVQYRWHFSQGDFVQLRAGIALSLHAELWDG